MEDLELQKFIQTYKKSEVVFSEGMAGKEMYIIYSGRVKLCRQREVLTKMDTGDFFGEMALIDDSPRSATAIADKDDTQLIVLDKKKFTYLLRHQPDFALVVMSRLAERLRNANKALAEREIKYESNKIKRKPNRKSREP
jgi:CRP/FNR family cyclic AMP-dependent transcriptional regulator